MVYILVMLFVANLKGGKDIMEKKVYVPATIEVVKFTSEDVLTASGTVNNNGYGHGSTIWGGKHHGFFFDEDDE